ncbi:Glycogen synthase [Paraliobacillus sp. PM-2]|uniref:glycogen synthase GlgA n=1 Tax=Paraliobacillus sp. PM-2 TaxID=1462524 RepID=UPI00061CD0BA|nr:glycogen synthase GlgA [Paraliobacillus sp. PM-2]CQR47115.1 Glycogen synthase [Paraliobacillus sp. PM-2]
MKILMVGSECSPFVKSGGLADVLGSLPQALSKQGAEVRVVLPKYQEMSDEWKEQLTLLGAYRVRLGWRNQYAGIETLTCNGITFYFIDNEYYFKRSNLYGFGDEAERFVFFNRSIFEMLKIMDWIPDVIHCHDWQTGLIPLYLHTHYQNDPLFHKIKTVFTIHNLKYQGIFPASILHELMDLDHQVMHEDGIEFYGNVNFMKAALNYADKVTTVSKTYAKEIQTSYYGENLDGVLRKRSEKLTGVINGIDISAYDPATDNAIPFPYESCFNEKIKNKSMLQKELGLPIDESIPMVGIVSRLVEQKGFDLIARVIDEWVEQDNVQLVVLGTGDYSYESLFRSLQIRYPTKVVAVIEFKETLARRIYAASDLFLMPSRFEPCGIGQLLALRYLSAPIVRETGGLVDTVTSFNEQTEEGNGFSFKNYNAHDMLYTIRRALAIYQNKNKWLKLVENMANSNLSWDYAAETYLEIYQSTVG